MAKKSAKPALPRILGAHVLVRPDPDEEKTPGGILIPATAVEQGKVEIDTQRGTVLEVGEGRYNEDQDTYRPPIVSVDERIVFYGATVEYQHEGEKLLIVPEGQILAVLP